MSIYNRPMFRKKGGAAGIMASGPELIKRSNGGGFNLFSSVQANPALSIPKQFDFDQGFKKILQRTPGVYGEGKPKPPPKPEPAVTSTPNLS